MIWALLFVVVSTSMVISHSTFMVANRKEMDTRNKSNLAANLARSGLTDALSWFQRQDNQPVTDFAPLLDEAATPPIMDTLDPAIGLVREFEVRGNLWGRYEVRHGAAEDISAPRGMTTQGAVWDLGARGILYRRVDPTVPFDQAPNRIESITALRTEVRNIPLRAPAQAAIAIGGPDKVIVNPTVSVIGGDKPAFAFEQDALEGVAQEVLDALPAEVLDGVPPTVGVVNYDSSPTKVFAMRLDQLMSFGDIVVSSEAALPENVDGYRVVFVEDSLTLSTGRGQRGDMLLVVNGDLVAEAGNDTDISGMIYVVGDAKIEGPFNLNGTMIVGGQLEIGGTAETTVIEYDGMAIDLLTQSLARYRKGHAVHSIPTLETDDGAGETTEGGRGGKGGKGGKKKWWHWWK